MQKIEFIKINTGGESFFIKVTKITKYKIYGTIDNVLINTPNFKYGDKVFINKKLR